MRKGLEIKSRLKKIYKETGTERFIISFSGGKDSVTILHLTLDFCLAEKIPVSVIHVDTLVENPVTREYCNNFLAKLNSWKKKKEIDIRIIIATPKPNMTFWINLIGKGYPMPGPRFRWCQKHLKIKPAQIALKNEKGVLLVGLRENESLERKKSMQQRYVDMKLKNTTMQIFAPIYDWNDDDVWEFLSDVRSSPWGEDYSKLISLYKEAKGECPLIPDTSFSGNGCGSRFGCWVCSVVRKDKTLTNLASQNLKLKELVNFRNWLIKFCSLPENRTGFTRTGKMVKEGKGMLSLKARQKILEELLKLQDKFRDELIKSWEIPTIKAVWEEDKRRFCGIL